jgi:hypothetical protein
MFTFGRTLFVFSLLIWAPAQAQSAPPPPSGPQNLDAGKSVAQMFASDCAICHKTPQSVARRGGMFGVENFLRAHYTTSGQSAAALAGYLRAVAAIPEPARPRKQAPKGDAKKPAAEPAKASATPDDKKPAEETKPAEAKPAEVKSAEPTPAEPKPADAKPADSKPADSKSE